MTCPLAAIRSRLHTTPCVKVIVVWPVVQMHDFDFLSSLPLLHPPPFMAVRSGAYILARAQNRTKLHDYTISICANC